MISILPLTRDHKSAWLPLWKAYIAFYESELPEEVTEKTWQRFHDDNEPLYAAGAFLDGELIGMTHYLFHRSTWTQHHYCYLEDLFITPQQRGKGVAQKLIRYVQSQARKATIQHKTLIIS